MKLYNRSCGQNHKAFIRKMENWRRKVGMENFAMLETVSEIVEECDAATQNLITQHLEALERGI